MENTISFLSAAFFALSGVTACDNGNSDRDDDDVSPAPEKLTTLDGATFVCGSYTLTGEYSESYYTVGVAYLAGSSGGSATGQVKKGVRTYTNTEYFTGTSDSTAIWYTWDETNHCYNSFDVSYRIDGDTITFTETYMGTSSDLPMTITGADSFTYEGYSHTTTYPSAGGCTVTTTMTDQVYTLGEIPASGSETYVVAETW